MLLVALLLVALSLATLIGQVALYRRGVFNGWRLLEKLLFYPVGLMPLAVLLLGAETPLLVHLLTACAVLLGAAAGAPLGRKWPATAALPPLVGNLFLPAMLLAMLGGSSFVDVQLRWVLLFIAGMLGGVALGAKTLAASPLPPLGSPQQSSSQ